LSVSPPNNRPKLPDPPPARRRRRRRAHEPVRSDNGALTKEFVAAGRLNAYGAATAALPQPIDDLTRDFGNDIYEQMLLDAQIAACVIVFKAAILEDGVELAPGVHDEQDPDYKVAVEIRDRATKMLGKLDTPLDDVLWSMLDATFLGNKVAEIVNVLEREDGKTWLRIRAIKPKPRQSVAFVVDRYLNLLGFLGAKPGQHFVSPTSYTPDASDILPRDKFAVLTWRPVDCDPRGTSMLRPAYEAWWRKRQMYPEYLKYLTQFAGPSIWAALPEGVAAAPVTDALGNPTGADGQPFDPAEDPGNIPADEDENTARTTEALQTLIDFRSGTAMVVPYGTEVNTIEMQGNGEAFLACFTESDSQIVHAILTQQLATEQSPNMARAAAQVHQDVLDTLVRQGKRAVVRMIQHDILKPWVIRNWGEDKADLCPVPTLGTTERQDLAALMNAVAALARIGFFHPSQLQYVDELLGLPARKLSTDNADPMPLRPKPATPGAPGAGGAGAKPGSQQPAARPSQQRQGQPSREPAREQERQAAAVALATIARYATLAPAEIWGALQEEALVA
jgi:hypothetical protein